MIPQPKADFRELHLGTTGLDPLSNLQRIVVLKFAYNCLKIRLTVPIRCPSKVGLRLTLLSLIPHRTEAVQQASQGGGGGGGARGALKLG